MTIWGPQQETALSRVAKWMHSREQTFYLGGYAGVGKTKLAKHFADGLDGPVYYLSYTAKAALVMRQFGCSDASTIHSQIYYSQQKSKVTLTLLKLEQEETVQGMPEGEKKERVLTILKARIAAEEEKLQQPAFTLNHDSDVKDAALVIVDEVSMVDQRIGRDLESLVTKLLVLGDPFQLPPVRGTGYFTAREPDYMLTEPHRFAKDSPVLRIATMVRNGEDLPCGNYGSSRVIDKADLTPEDAMEADQILVGRNATRRGTNHRMRSLGGYTGTFPEGGDKLVCLRNNHEIGILNGSLWDCNGCWDDGEYLHIEVHGDDGMYVEVPVWKQHFLRNGGQVPWWDRTDAEEFDYGYALTVHKAQGSQWDKVLLLDEWHMDNRRRWLYTGITRAAEQTTVVNM